MFTRRLERPMAVNKFDVQDVKKMLHDAGKHLNEFTNVTIRISNDRSRVGFNSDQMEALDAMRFSIGDLINVLWKIHGMLDKM
jgi:hypothetical protein